MKIGREKQEMGNIWISGHIWKSVQWRACLPYNVDIQQEWRNEDEMVLEGTRDTEDRGSLDDNVVDHPRGRWKYIHPCKCLSSEGREGVDKLHRQVCHTYMRARELYCVRRSFSAHIRDQQCWYAQVRASISWDFPSSSFWYATCVRNEFSAARKSCVGGKKKSLAPKFLSFFFFCVLNVIVKSL